MTILNESDELLKILEYQPEETLFDPVTTSNGGDDSDDFSINFKTVF